MVPMLRFIGAFFLDIIETVVIALSIFLILYLFIMQPHQVNGQSMDPTFHHAEYVMTDKLSYKFGTPQRGDVVVFRAPPAANCPEGSGCDFIKRVIGLPGDTVEVRNNQLIINGIGLDETYLDDTVNTLPGPFTNQGSVIVPPDNYFVVGDNREHSSDSRAWGPVTFDHLVGKVFFRYWPLNRFGVITHAQYPNL
jgi:signal peptidase I